MKAKRCIEDKCNMFALNVGTKDKCKVHFYKARNPPHPRQNKGKYE